MAVKHMLLEWLCINSGVAMQLFRISDVVAHLSISPQELRMLLEEIQSDGYISQLNMRNPSGFFYCVVDPCARRFVREGGYARQQELRHLEDEKLMLEVQNLRTEAEEVIRRLRGIGNAAPAVIERSVNLISSLLSIASRFGL